ncbi:MAG: carbamoyltransferase HypF [Elusimicrobia bacterium RIFOXYA2_FULL_50_26]|nr:MAG: carbamoyltransferase HypF [Elusimicrobia bacterium RIFOXYA2_FULL_50_26]
MSKVSKANDVKALRITVGGTVQGVGFRPYVYRLAGEHKIAGNVANTAAGAVIEAEGTPAQLSSFIDNVKHSLPPRALITSIKTTPIPFRNFKEFSIQKSSSSSSALSAIIPPDLAVCPDCLRELFTSSDRRHNYPFINCTNCGPRFSIVKALPYDRPETSMSSFRLCPECRKEYDNPADRRFHAQPNACPACGPVIELYDSNFTKIARAADAMAMAVAMLEKGKILAIKSIGGYHLACDATNTKAVERLRKRKMRPHKPFAVMAASPESAGEISFIGAEEERLLASIQRPIVLLKKRLPSKLADNVAPGNASVGIMLCYTPLHHILFNGSAYRYLVMTSANRRDEPICRTEEDAREALGEIADYFLVHNRPIHNRLDDSIVQCVPATQFIRRSRGYVPEPVRLGNNPGKTCVMGVGAELKNTFCLTRGNNAFVSQHIGEMDNLKSIDFYREAFERLSTFLKVKPGVIAHDLHPGYFTTAFAREYASANRVRLVGVQHHVAHIASVLAETNIKRPVIGFAFDGLGYGDDGTLWGGECLLVHREKFTRLAHFDYFALAGGDAATREIWRCGAALLKSAGINALPANGARRRHWQQALDMIGKRFNSPLTCSVGRLFDGVAAIIGIRDEVSFEAQAAMEMETLAIDFPVKKGYNFKIKNQGGDKPLVVSTTEIVRQLWAEKKAGMTPAHISARFHVTIAEITRELALRFRAERQINDIALSGGVFQNRLLLGLVLSRLLREGFAVHYNRLVPPNDGGISLGQAWIGKQHVSGNTRENNKHR